MEIFGGVLGLVVIVFLLVIVVLWCILPFAVFGIKERLDQTIAELLTIQDTLALCQDEIRKTNRILKTVHNLTEEEEEE